MEQRALTIVEDTREVVLSRLKREWDAINVAKETGDLDYDVKRAQVLQRYLALEMADGEKLTQKQIGACVGIKQGWFQALLRYGRFMLFLNSTEFKVSEGRFRRYWAETADHAYMSTFRRKQDKYALEDYERIVFQQIAAKLEKGIVPTVSSTARTKKVTDIKPAQLASLRKAVASYQVLKRKEVREVYTKIEEDVRALIELSGCSRATYAPSILAMHARRLKEGFAALQKALKGNVDAWLLEVMD